MKLNNFMFKEEFAYTYEEVLKELHINSTPPLMNKMDFAFLISSQLGTIEQGAGNTTITSNKMAYSFLDVGTVSEKVSQSALNVINKLWGRYGKHYAVVVGSEDEFNEASKEFMLKVLNVLDYTFVKYDTLLNMYENQKSHLLDKLSRVRSEDRSHQLDEEHSNTRVRDEDKSNSASGQHSTTKGTEVDATSNSASKSAGSDVPQTINVQASYDELKGYFNKYDQASDEGTSHSEGSETDSGTNSSSGTENIDVEETDNGTNSASGTENIEATETYDPTTLMARIDEVQKQFDNVILKWVNEFDRLFIEEGNI